jgi:hypothetical protein
MAGMGGTDGISIDTRLTVIVLIPASCCLLVCCWSNVHSIEHLYEVLPHRGQKIHNFFEQVFETCVRDRYRGFLDELPDAALWS